MSDTEVTRVGEGVYRVQHGGRSHLVYVAGPPEDRWLYWNGRVFHRPFAAGPAERAPSARGEGALEITAPMPATVLKVLVEPGASVRRGDTLVLLEAMKMELPLTADTDATVVAVACRDGELVQPGAVLVTLA